MRFFALFSLLIPSFAYGQPVPILAPGTQGGIRLGDPRNPGSSPTQTGQPDTPRAAPIPVDITSPPRTSPIEKLPDPKPAPSTASSPSPSTAVPTVRSNGLYGTMVTTNGAIEFRLYENEAPITVKNFIDLCLGRKQWTDPVTHTKSRRPLIPGTMFHRVIPKFMIQGGDPSGTGAGDVGFVIPDEFHPELKYDQPGRFGMANAGPGTGSSQFFITEVPTPWLDGKHTIFGQVIKGQEVVDAIARVARSPENKPNTPVKIVKVTFQREGPAPPSAPEGVAPAPKKAAAPVKAPVPATKAPIAAPKPLAPKPAAAKPAAAPPAKKAAAPPAATKK